MAEAETRSTVVRLDRHDAGLTACSVNATSPLRIHWDLVWIPEGDGSGVGQPR
jgi:hypothetical protein